MPATGQYRKIRVFVASPGDVNREREGIKRVIESLNRVFSERYRVILELKEWRQVVPDMGLPQEVIFEQLKVEAWDIFVGILWLRFGMSPGTVDPESGRAFDSGTEHEFTVAHRAWQKLQRPRILFYRCLRLPPRLLDIDGVQFGRVGAFFKQFDANGPNPGLFAEYLEVEDFKDLVREHLEQLVLEDAEKAADAAPPATRSVQDLIKRAKKPRVFIDYEATETVAAESPFTGASSAQQPGTYGAGFKNPFIIGRPITDPADFFGRERETEFALARLRTGQSVSVVGERRIGKTSLLHFIRHRVERELAGQITAGFLDLMGATVRTPEALLARVQDALGVADPAETLAGLAERLATMSKAGRPPLLAFDEMEMAIRFPGGFARDFFEGLRAAAQAGHLTLLSASRISLQEMHEQGALVSPLYNIMGRLSLGLFTEAEAREFVMVRRSGVRFSEEQVAEILRRGQGHPMRLQALCFHAAQASHEKRSDWAEIWAEAEAEAAAMLEPPCTDAEKKKA